MRSLLFTGAIALCSLIASAQENKSKLDRISVKGQFQWRTESAVNRRAVQGSRQSELSLSRFRAFIKLNSNEKLSFNLTPQAAKGFGAKDGNDITSGTTNHTEINFLESNLQYKLSKALEVKLGRQQIGYGDFLVIGKRPWNNTSASFDAIKFRYQLTNGWVDGAFSKISDEGTARVSNDDTDFAWIYSSFNLGQMFQEVDVYLMHQDNDSSSPVEVNTLGFRIKGSHGDAFFRTENGIQQGSNLGDEAFQYNFEVGRRFKKYSISAEWAHAGKNYREMYPNPHKFLGLADVLARRNLKQVAIHLRGKPADWLAFGVDYHKFERSSTDAPAYTFLNASTWGTNGSSSDVGSEVDFFANFISKDNIRLLLGYSLFMPGTYMKQNQNNLDETTRFTYAQIRATF